MSTAASTILVSGLAKGKFHALKRQAKAAGLSTERYAKQLIEEGVSLEQQARTRSFDSLYAAVQDRFRDSGMSEPELDDLVNSARLRYRRSKPKKKA